MKNKINIVNKLVRIREQLPEKSLLDSYMKLKSYFNTKEHSFSIMTQAELEITLTLGNKTKIIYVRFNPLLNYCSFYQSNKRNK